MAPIIYADSTYSIVTDRDIVDDKWHSICIVFEGTFGGRQLHVYIDGTLDSSANRNVSIGANTATPQQAFGALVEGTTTNGALFFEGEFEYIGLAYKPYNTREVKTLYEDPYQFLIPE